MFNAKRAALVALLVSASAPALAVVDYTGLDVDVTGLDVAAIGIATTMLGVLAVFWGIRKIMSLVG